jgi:hypothetical protein
LPIIQPWEGVVYDSIFVLIYANIESETLCFANSCKECNLWYKTQYRRLIHGERMEKLGNLSVDVKSLLIQGQWSIFQYIEGTMNCFMIVTDSKEKFLVNEAGTIIRKCVNGEEPNPGNKVYPFASEYSNSLSNYLKRA